VTGPRDWDKELAGIDKAIARTPGEAEPVSAVVPARRAAVPAPTPQETTTTWLRVLLAATLAGALPFWPYARGCGIGLYLYLAGAAMVIVAGIWAAVSTWQRRRSRAHAFSLLVLLWGVGLVFHEVLPRVGYAKQPARWTCG
jgi:hypothetical protein